MKVVNYFLCPTKTQPSNKMNVHKEIPMFIVLEGVTSPRRFSFFLNGESSLLASRAEFLIVKVNELS